VGIARAAANTARHSWRTCLFTHPRTERPGRPAESPATGSPVNPSSWTWHRSTGWPTNSRRSSVQSAAPAGQCAGRRGAAALGRDLDAGDAAAGAPPMSEQTRPRTLQALAQGLHWLVAHAAGHAGHRKAEAWRASRHARAELADPAKPACAGPALHRRSPRRDRLAGWLQFPVGLVQRGRLARRPLHSAPGRPVTPGHRLGDARLCAVVDFRHIIDSLSGLVPTRCDHFRARRTGVGHPDHLAPSGTERTHHQDPTYT